MKRYTLFLIIILIIFGSVFLLLNNTKENPKEAGTVPGSYLYFVDLFVEKVRLNTAFQWASKVSIIKRNIDERLLEAEELLIKDNINQDEINILLDNIESDFKNISTIVNSNSNDSDYIENLTSDLYSSFSSFNNKVNKEEVKLSDEIKIIIEKFESNDIAKNKSIDEARNKLESVLIINDSVTLINNLFNEINLDILGLLPEQDSESLIKHYRNEEFERLREEADVYNLNLPSGLFMTLGPSDELETIEVFRNIIEENKEELFNKYIAHIQLIEAELYGDSEKEYLSIDQWNTYQRFLSESQAEFNAGNFEKAKNLADQAKNHIIMVLE